MHQEFHETLSILKRKKKKYRKTRTRAFNPRIWLLDKCMLFHILVSSSNIQLFSFCSLINQLPVEQDQHRPKMSVLWDLASTLWFLSLLLTYKPMTGKESLISISCNRIICEKIYLKLHIRKDTFIYSKCPFMRAHFFFLKVGCSLMSMLEDSVSEVCGFYNYEAFQHKPVGTSLAKSASQKTVSSQTPNLKVNVNTNMIKQL